jgi:hypothetical protein
MVVVQVQEAKRGKGPIWTLPYLAGFVLICLVINPNPKSRQGVADPNPTCTTACPNLAIGFRTIGATLQGGRHLQASPGSSSRWFRTGPGGMRLERAGGGVGQGPEPRPEGRAWDPPPWQGETG